jgi:hypothetical protein
MGEAQVTGPSTYGNRTWVFLLFLSAIKDFSLLEECFQIDTGRLLALGCDLVHDASFLQNQEGNAFSGTVIPGSTFSVQGIFSV